MQTVNVEQPKRKKGSYGTNTKKLIEDYGIERLKHEYIDNNRYSAELAAEIGVSKTTLDMHLRKLGITKRKKHKDENKEASEKEDN